MTRTAMIVAAGVISISTQAHHSNDYHFDRNVGVTVSGTVKAFRFINPHSRLLVDVAGEDGSVVTWDCEMGGANVMMRRGWTRDVFRPGDEIVIQGIAARRHETECYFDSAAFADGRVVALDDSFDADAPAAERRVYGVSVPAGIPDLPASGTARAASRAAAPRAAAPRLGAANVLAEVLTEAGRQALAEYDPVFDDPALTCSPVSIRRLWSNNDLHEIEQTEDRVVIRHEWMDAVRGVRLDMDEHPADLESRVLGHSIGWYEGSTLVIDTVGYEAGMWAQHPGLPHSDQLHTVERLTLGESGDSFELTIVAEDPLYYTESLTTTRSLRASDQVVREYNCTHPELGH